MPDFSTFNLDNDANNVINDNKRTIVLNKKLKSNFASLLNIFDKNGDKNLDAGEIQNIMTEAKKASQLKNKDNVLDENEAQRYLKENKADNVGASKFIEFLNFIVKSLKSASTPLDNENSIVVNDKEIRYAEKGELPIYSAEELKKMYPADKYTIETTSNKGDVDKKYVIYDKDGKKAAKYIYYKDGSIDVTKYGKKTIRDIYDKDGNHIYHQHGSKGYSPYYKKFVKDMINDMAYSSKRDSVLERINKIDKNNVVDILYEYENLDSNVGIFQGIMLAPALNDKDKKEAMTKIFNSLVDACKERGIYTADLEKKFNKEITQFEKLTKYKVNYLDVYLNQLLARYKAGNGSETKITEPNGKIDGDFKMSKTGDCWLLSAIKGIANTPKGREILNNSIKVNSDGSVSVTLIGADKTYTISKEELNGRTELASGDGDIRALEIAVERFFEEQKGSDATNGQLDINANKACIAYMLLTGKICDNIIEGIEDMNPKEKIVAIYRVINGEYNGAMKIVVHHTPTDAEIDRVNDENVVTCVAASKEKSSMECRTSSGGKGKLLPEHEYSVVRSDSEYVYLINPWDSSEELIVDRKTFKEFFNDIEQMEL